MTGRKEEKGVENSLVEVARKKSSGFQGRTLLACYPHENTIIVKVVGFL